MKSEDQASFEQVSRTSAQFMHRRSRCYGFTAGISSIATTIAGYEAVSRLESSNPVELVIGGAAGLAAIAGSIAVLGCTQIAIDSHRWARAIEEGK